MWPPGVSIWPMNPRMALRLRRSRWNQRQRGQFVGPQVGDGGRHPLRDVVDVGLAHVRVLSLE